MELSDEVAGCGGAALMTPDGIWKVLCTDVPVYVVVL